MRKWGWFLVVLGIQVGFPASNVGHAQTGSPGAYVVDSKGKIVGAYFIDGVLLRLQPTADLVLMRPLTNGFEAPTYVYYTTPDCTGEAYLFTAGELNGEAGTDPIHPRSIIYPAPTGTNVTIKSARNRFDGKCGSMDSTGTLHAVQSVPMDALGFTPPFAVKWH